MKLFTIPVTSLILYSLAINGLFSLPVAAEESESARVTTNVAADTLDCACFEVNVVGAGPDVLLIPGLSSSGDVWESTVEALSANYRLHVLTLAGFGGVEPLAHDAWGDGFLSSQQEAILQYIRQQKLDEPIVIGHSLGGYLAMALAAKAPESIGGAINVDGLPALGALFAQATPNATDESIAENVTPTSFDPMAMAQGMANNENWHQRIVNDILRADAETSGRVMGELMQADLRPALAGIRVPVLTLGALQHGAPYSTPEQVQKNFEDQLASAPSQYHSVAFATDSKHFIMADAPDWLNQQIIQFLHSHSAKGK